jgi:hypothetical protein
MALYVYRFYQIPEAPSLWARFRWDSVAKAPIRDNLSHSGAFVEVLYDDNIIVDVFQKAAGEVAIITYNASNFRDSNPAYPQQLLARTIMTSSHGDTQNTLLYKRCNTGDSPPTFEFAIYGHTSKEVSTYSYPLTNAPFCEAYGLAPDVIVSQSCIGTTLRRTYYDEADGVTIEDTVNSSICGYVAPVPDVVVTEVKRIKVDNTCYKNPYYLVWKNTLGGWDHWLFYNTQTENLITNDLGSFTNEAFVDLSFSEGQTKSLGKNADNSIVLGADNLTTNQREAIKDLLISPSIYKVETDGSKKIVRIKPGTFSSEKKSERHSIEFEIYPPETYTVKS